ncbi:MAG TPA: DUF169 domain-containing protein [Chloroflexota bacterium]|nr:DUF169 domain-containing protein [Chloroflexota bacterium]
MSLSQTAALLQQRLNLDLPPVALTLVSERPEGIENLTEQVPSACTFWRRAERGVFYASADDHMGCAIGGMVMGFELSESKTKELMGLVEQMCAICYLQPEEVPHIPQFKQPSSGVVYGPLSQFPLVPDVALIWVTPAQAMLLQESVGAVQWADSPSNAVFGRPACGVLPTAAASGQTTLSLGCMGMRTFTEIPADRCLIAIPGSILASLGDKMEQTFSANEKMREFYVGHKASY